MPRMESNEESMDHPYHNYKEGTELDKAETHKEEDQNLPKKEDKKDLRKFPKGQHKDEDGNHITKIFQAQQKEEDNKDVRKFSEGQHKDEDGNHITKVFQVSAEEDKKNVRKYSKGQHKDEDGNQSNYAEEQIGDEQESETNHDATKEIYNNSVFPQNTNPITENMTKRNEHIAVLFYTELDCKQCDYSTSKRHKLRNLVSSIMADQHQTIFEISITNEVNTAKEIYVVKFLGTKPI